MQTCKYSKTVHLFCLLISAMLFQQNCIAQNQNTVINGVTFNYPLSPYASSIDYSTFATSTNCGRAGSDWVNDIEFGLDGSGSALLTITLPTPSNSLSFLLGAMDQVYNETVTYVSNNGNGSVTLSTDNAGVTGCLALSGNTIVSSGVGSNGKVIITADQPFTEVVLSITGPYNVISTLSTTVPVKLVSFKGSPSNCNAILSWSTAEESNLDNFEILSSEDGINFKTIGKLLPQGNNSTYNFKTANSNNTFFKLKMNDLDGSYKYSSVVKVNAGCKEQVKLISANPIAGQLRLSGLQKEDVIQIINEIGQTVLTKHGLEANTIDVKYFSAGVYTLRILPLLKDPVILRFVKQ